MSENIAAAIAAKNEVIAQLGTSLDEVAAVLETKAAGGTDISLGLTSAAVGQIIKVKAIDASGKPTAWAPVDMPGGSVGGQVFDEVVMLSEAVNEWSIDVPEGITDVKLRIAIPAVEANMTYGHILTNGAQSGFITTNWVATSREIISGVSWLVFKNGTIGQILAGNGSYWSSIDSFKNAVKDVTSLTSIGIKAYGAQTFPVGTTISVRGRS